MVIAILFFKSNNKMDKTIQSFFVRFRFRIIRNMAIKATKVVLR